MQAEKERSRFLTDIVDKPGAGQSREAVKDARPAIPTPMLDVVFRSGAIVSFSYAYLTRIDFDPSGKLALSFGDDVVVIEGRNLFTMRDKLRMHKASEIQEGDDAEDELKPENAAHVERIRIVKEKEAHQEVRNESGRNKSLER